jgi:hypothetical protein
MAIFFPTSKSKKINYKLWFYNENVEQKKEPYARMDKEIVEKRESRGFEKKGSGHYIKFTCKELGKLYLQVNMYYFSHNTFNPSFTATTF